MKIGIYGGSFNPIHKGHIEIAKQAIKELQLDNLFFVPAFKNPFKSKIKYSAPEHRMNMINLVKPKKSEVSDFEIRRKGASYTIDTVRYFKNKFPNAELFLIIGSDNVYKLNKWKSINEIAEKTQIIIFKRKGAFSKVNIKRYNAKLLNNNLFDYASTSFRNGHLLENVDDNVMRYISQNFLYIPDILVNMVDAKRHKHSLAVGSLAAQYAKKLNLDSEKAWAAGTLHDITKGMPKKWHREFLNSKNVNEKEMEDFQLHSLSAYYWLRDEYLLQDKEILNAIRIHTSLEEEISLFDKVVYAADKLAEGRRFEGIQKLRELMFSDFEKGFKELISIVYKHLIETRGNLKKKQIEIYERWM